MVAQQGELGLWDVPGARPFWIRGAFTESNTVAFSEQVADNYRHERVHIRAGDIVLDCGADYGGVTWKALESGASKVVAIEIDPGKIACLNRTFAKEIAAGRVVVVPMGLWDHEDTLELDGDSVVMGRTSRKTRVKVDRMDRIIGDLGLPRVDFIAMDIEGAEKPALRGGSETLRRFAPRMAIAAEHLPDDATAIPALMRELVPGRYEVIGGRCDLVGERIAPTVLFFEPKGN